MKEETKKLLDVHISNLSKKQVLEQIKKWLQGEKGIFQLATVNPEILVRASKDERFKKVLNNAQIATPDGIGILLGGKILGCAFKERVTGVSLLKSMVKMAADFRLSVGLIGGKADVALKAGECLKKEHPNFKFFALEGFKDVKKKKAEEWKKILTIIADFKPQMLFVGFGAPFQEFFIDDLKKKLKSDWPMVVVGVGGAFDEISGRIKRVPKVIDKIGLKWLWRLVCQPWRWRRQLALLEFLYLVLKEKLNLQRGDVIRSR